jgi:hypothetical protein
VPRPVRTSLRSANLCARGTKCRATIKKVADMNYDPIQEITHQYNQR